MWPACGLHDLTTDLPLTCQATWQHHFSATWQLIVRRVNCHKYKHVIRYRNAFSVLLLKLTNSSLESRRSFSGSVNHKHGKSFTLWTLSSKRSPLSQLPLSLLTAAQNKPMVRGTSQATIPRQCASYAHFHNLQTAVVRLYYLYNISLSSWRMGKPWTAISSTAITSWISPCGRSTKRIRMVIDSGNWKNVIFAEAR